ncbi:hypothetical protein [Flammeovirga pacifica]|uniref:Uncharacterized protein n=1 Tax=Flammeovirga pacifica TaxID=915059 RepID=A0A1S1Z515_FLAPC|nr:hypothetical protein [Flammeovirga pacifica]OHX68384.1 hypothetical protein NH26_19530 [Flammeovirga pacifica]
MRISKKLKANYRVWQTIPLFFLIISVIGELLEVIRPYLENSILGVLSFLFNHAGILNKMLLSIVIFYYYWSFTIWKKTTKKEEKKIFKIIIIIALIIIDLIIVLLLLSVPLSTVFVNFTLITFLIFIVLLFSILFPLFLAIKSLRKINSDHESNLETFYKILLLPISITEIKQKIKDANRVDRPVSKN